jgi:hypothetical protein
MTSDGDNATQLSAPASINVRVNPISDCLVFTAPSSIVVEDLQGGSAAPVGNDIANGYTVADNGLADGGANNPETEYISQIQLKGTDLNFTSSPNFPSGALPSLNLGPGLSGIMLFDNATNTITISSSIIDGKRTTSALGTLTTTELSQAQGDILFVLRSIVARPLLAQSDVNQAVLITATTIDVNPILMNANETSCSRNQTVIVKAFADSVFVTTVDIPSNVYAEDDINGTLSWKPKGIPLNITVSASVDGQDLSESLDVQITIPYDARFQAPIGTLNVDGTLTGITFTPNGVNGAGELVYKVVSTAPKADDQAVALNNFFATQLYFLPAEDWSGNPTGVNGIKVVLTTTEGASGAEVERKTSNSTAYIGVDVLPRVSKHECL